VSNKNKNRDGIVYSTDPGFSFADLLANKETKKVNASAQKLKVVLDKKHRAGKIVTLVTGFQGNEEALERLAKMLKSQCGSGGSAKDGEIIIQGDHLEKVKTLLIKEGHQIKN
jgi:translation initiation factor 1